MFTLNRLNSLNTESSLFFLHAYAGPVCGVRNVQRNKNAHSTSLTVSI